MLMISCSISIISMIVVETVKCIIYGIIIEDDR